MKRYVIELRPDCKVVQEICESDGKVIIGAKSINYLDEFTVDYIQRNCKSLLDAFYQKGLEDGKAVHEKGCEGCEYEEVVGLRCRCCANRYPNQWKAKQTDDEIKVGDEVTHKSDSVVWKAVCIQIDVDGRHMNLMGHTGAVGYYPVDDFKKTGRHYDIDKILEAMKA